MRRYLLIGILCLCGISMAQVLPQRVPARRDAITRVQPNGDSLTYYLRGDEWYHWNMTLDGWQIKENSQGYLCYAIWQGDSIVSSSRIAHNVNKRSKCELRWLRKHGIQKNTISQAPRRRVIGDPRTPSDEVYDAMRRASAQTFHTPGIATLTLPQRVLVIMVQFSDYTFSTTKAHADSLFNAKTLLTTDTHQGVVKHGSVAKYFEDQSLGQYRPIFDIVGPITLNKSYTNFPGSSNGGTLTQLACTAVDDSVNFANYDNDHDGNIDMVFIFYAGFGQNDKDYIDSGFGVNVNALIWPHYNSGGSGTFDGKQLQAYECSNELDGYFSKPGALVSAGAGILVHEFSHGMGLPDVYLGSTQYMGAWDLMDYGCYNGGTYIPAPYTGFERWFCGWSKPYFMNSAEDVTLHPIDQSGEFGVITSNGLPCDSLSSTQHWIIENHQQHGWDTYSMGSGLILYQMQYHTGWGKSTNLGLDGCKLLPADGILRVQGDVGKKGDCYPYNDLDSIYIVPSYPITHISQETNGNITFKVCGGKPTPTEGVTTTISNNASWHKEIQNGQIVILCGQKQYSILGL